MGHSAIERDGGRLSQPTPPGEQKRRGREKSASVFCAPHPYHGPPARADCWVICKKRDLLNLNIARTGRRPVVRVRLEFNRGESPVKKRLQEIGGGVGVEAFFALASRHFPAGALAVG